MAAVMIGRSGRISRFGSALINDSDALIEFLNGRSHFLPLVFLLTLASLNPLATLMALMFRNIPLAVFRTQSSLFSLDSHEKHHLLVLGPSADRLLIKRKVFSAFSDVTGPVFVAGSRAPIRSQRQDRYGQVETWLMSHWGA